jgi:2-keto-4-pentenoate hydratase/2-oxohepta-3-ene-1,7-dioic acid hydratase in catechol pathway|tara:strand:- start:292 stop:1203 length:912 start_codon:yes stop_codon:yes gene_type:complete
MSYKLANVSGRSVLVNGDHYFDLAKISEGNVSSDPSQVVNSLGAISKLYKQIDQFDASGSLKDVQMGPPVTGSRNCFAVGLNYRNHAEESGMEIPPFPMIFTKHTSCINGPFDNIEMRSDIVDYEAELVVVIGKQGKNISNDEAWNHVAGLTVGQDISDRSVQFHATPPQFNLGKSFDTFGPIGPILVSPDQFEDKSSLNLECSVNGELRQKDNTNDLIFDIPYIISYVSEFITLEPGDLIFTGTPAGVGATQGKLLKDGDILSTTIEGIGSMENKCVRISDHANASYIPEFVKGKMPDNNQD